jgi:hypothetical protein
VRGDERRPAHRAAASSAARAAASNATSNTASPPSLASGCVLQLGRDTCAALTRPSPRSLAAYCHPGVGERGRDPRAGAPCFGAKHAPSRRFVRRHDHAAVAVREPHQICTGDLRRRTYQDTAPARRLYARVSRPRSPPPQREPVAPPLLREPFDHRAPAGCRARPPLRLPILRPRPVPTRVGRAGLAVLAHVDRRTSALHFDAA